MKSEGVKFVGIQRDGEEEKDYDGSAAPNGTETTIVAEHEGNINEEQDLFEPESKSRNFEFTNNMHLMRSIRVVYFLQIIGIIIDSPSLNTPTIFSVFCNKGFYYILHFYSRPFLDAVSYTHLTLPTNREV